MFYYLIQNHAIQNIEQYFRYSKKEYLSYRFIPHKTHIQVCKAQANFYPTCTTQGILFLFASLEIHPQNVLRQSKWIENYQH